MEDARAAAREGVAWRVDVSGPEAPDVTDSTDDAADALEEGSALAASDVKENGSGPAPPAAPHGRGRGRE